MKTFSFELDSEGIGIIRIDLPGEKVNKLRRETLMEMEDLLNQLGVNQ